MVGLDLIRSILKVCHEEELSILPSSCCFNSRWALCSKRFWGLVCLVIYLLFYLWVGKVHNGFTDVEETPLSTLFGYSPGCFSTANCVFRSLCNIEEFKFFHVLVIDASECADGHA